MEKPNILIVEDEEKIARLLELELGFEGYETTKCIDGVEAFSIYRERGWDLILLDIMLPGISGMELLRRIREKDQHTPIILLTAKDSVEEKVSGLDIGANDYITKPFEIEELLARIRATFRISTQQRPEEPKQDDFIQVADLRLNEKTREVYRGDDSIDLTPREFDLLAYLMKHRRQVLNREQILDRVWGFNYYGDTNVVDVYIRYLRNKMDKPYKHTLIHTVRGIGYVMKELQ
jgi:two-component system, OmpR family, response regulator